jgi:CRISPR/Cas system-associated exonuclease Cas4 (RecB family)
MRPILESLAIYLTRRGADSLGDTRIILPNRRSGIFLQRHLAQTSPGVSWSPRIQAINEFIGETSEMEAVDQLEMVFTLYDLYQDAVDVPEPVDEFYHWGELMLSDFDEIDKYLVDADMLFSNVRDLKEIEEPLAGLDDQQIGFIRQFWEGFQAGGASDEKEKFLGFWELLPRLYHGLRERLSSGGLGYQGMLYREVVEKIAKGVLPSPPGGTIVAGFNALNGCEKQIFSWLKRHGAEFFWDYDQSYLADQHQEAGRFIRENLNHFPPPVELDTFNSLKDEKEIRIFELPSDVLQAKTVYRILEEHVPALQDACTETALILCDEELLMPVITSLPANVEEINVTMGYPMKSTPVYGFIDTLLRMQHNTRRSPEGTEQFYHRDVSAVLLHPYLRRMEGNMPDNRLEEISHSNLIYVDRPFFTGHLEQIIFRCVEGATELLDYLRSVFQQILENLAGDESLVHRQLDREFIFQLLIHLNKLEAILASRPEISANLAERLFRKILSGIRIPFEGEPLAGVQIMGILETRMLDFRHVVLLSMNEEIMPAAHQGYSYIPYTLRRAFRMPAKEEMDAIYAYYFNRLLQRAEKVDLLYNSGSEGMRTGEMSRYLHQLVYSRGTEVIRPGMDISAMATSPLVVAHTPEMDRMLDRLGEEGADGKYLSPSAINAYMDCSLKFYLRYVAGIGEPDEVKEEIDAAGFGTVVHESIRSLYEEIAARNKGILTREELEQLLRSSHPEEVLRRSFLRYHFHGKKHASIEGRNIIAFRVMLRYLEKIIQTDIKIAPLKLISAEQTYTGKLTIKTEGGDLNLMLGGKIDRVDFVEDRIRVIDYKTGEARTQFSSIESLFDSSAMARNGAAFQTLFYAWLVGISHPDEKIMPGLYAMRSLYEPGFDPALFLGSRQPRTRLDSFGEVEQEFTRHLRITLSGIFDRTIPFTQTENRMKCRICNFAAICNRTFLD